MRLKNFLTVTLFFAICSIAIQAQSLNTKKEVLIYKGIVKLVKFVDLRDETIITKTDQSQCNFNTSKSARPKLTAAHGSKNIIGAMINPRYRTSHPATTTSIFQNKTTPYSSPSANFIGSQLDPCIYLFNKCEIKEINTTTFSEIRISLSVITHVTMKSKSKASIKDSTTKFNKKIPGMQAIKFAEQSKKTLAINIHKGAP